MLQQDENGQLRLVMMSNLQGHGKPKVQVIALQPSEMAILAAEQARDLEEEL